MGPRRSGRAPGARGGLGDREPHGCSTCPNCGLQGCGLRPEGADDCRLGPSTLCVACVLGTGDGVACSAPVRLPPVRHPRGIKMAPCTFLFLPWGGAGSRRTILDPCAPRPAPWGAHTRPPAVPIDHR